MIGVIVIIIIIMIKVIVIIMISVVQITIERKANNSHNKIVTITIIIIIITKGDSMIEDTKMISSNNGIIVIIETAITVIEGVERIITTLVGKGITTVILEMKVRIEKMIGIMINTEISNM